MQTKYFSTETEEGNKVIDDVFTLIDLTKEFSALLEDNWTKIVREVTDERGRDCAFGRKACLLLAIEDLEKYKKIIEELNTLVNRIPSKEEFYNVEQ